MTVLRAVAAALLATFVGAFSAAPAAAVDRALGADAAKPALGGESWSDAGKARLAVDIDALLAGAPTLRGAHVGLLVLDTKTGDVLYAHAADDAFVPASTMKLLTGSVALATLGDGYRFHTEAYLNPSKTELVMRAAGDPLLDVADLATLAQAVRSAGVGALPLGVGIDASTFAAAPYPPGWSWDDLVYDYAPVVSAAAVEENVLHLTVEPGSAIGRAARVTGAPAPFAGPFALPIDGCTPGHDVVVVPRVTTVAAGSVAAIDLARDDGGCVAVVGTIPLGTAAQTVDMPVPNPVWYLRSLATFALNAGGVTTARLDGPGGSGIANAGEAGVPAGAIRVWTHDGETLADLVADMWWPSDNFIAEELLETIGIAQGGGRGTLERGIAAERAWLTRIGIDPATLTLADGSGLSAYDRLTPRALAAILQADWNGPDRDTVLADLPLAGVRGTLARSFAGTLAERRTFAKTGSVMHARGLAGFLATQRHGAVTLAWSIDDWMGTNADLDLLRGRLLSRIIGD